MNWHARYSQQANWTRKLREYLFERAGLMTAARVVEIGCGTGAILSEVNTKLLHGVDIQPASLFEARVHAPAANLTCGDALNLPYPNKTFDITYCHFLLLWVSDPLAALIEMKRVTRPGGHVLALAEPDYSARIDEPPKLAVLGCWQAESLQRQGADPSFGGQLSESFKQAGIELVETGTIGHSSEEAISPIEWELEWAVLENDLAGYVSIGDIQYLKKMDEQARMQGKRILHVPTYFAWGRV